jgi:hypothetical protein
MAANPVQLLDPAEAAAILKISTKTLDRRRKARLITPVVLGPRLPRYPLDIVQEIALNGFPDAPREEVRPGRPRKALTTHRRLS